MPPPVEKQLFCTDCHRLVPPNEVGFDDMTGERIHINDSPYPNNDCEGLLIDASPVETSPVKFEQLLLDQAHESQPSLTDSPPHLARQHFQALEALASLVSDFVTIIKQEPTPHITADFTQQAEKLLHLLNKLLDHHCPECSVSLIPSGLADASLLCPLCLKRFAPPSEPSTIPSPSQES